MKQPFGAKLAGSYLSLTPWVAANREREDAHRVLVIGENCRTPNITIVGFRSVERLGSALAQRPGLLAHGIAVYFEPRAAAAEINAVAEEVLAAERKPDAHSVLKRPGEATGVVLTVTVSPHRRIEHRG